MVLLEDSAVISSLLLQNPKLQETFIIDFIKLDIFNKTHLTKVYNLKYNIHLSSVFWSTSYTYNTTSTSETDNVTEIPVYTKVFIDLQTPEALIKKYPTYNILKDTPSLSQSVGILSLRDPLNHPAKKKNGSTRDSKNAKITK